MLHIPYNRETDPNWHLTQALQNLAGGFLQHQQRKLEQQERPSLYAWAQGGMEGPPPEVRTKKSREFIDDLLRMRVQYDAQQSIAEARQRPRTTTQTKELEDSIDETILETLRGMEGGTTTRGEMDDGIPDANPNFEPSAEQEEEIRDATENWVQTMTEVTGMDEKGLRKLAETGLKKSLPKLGKKRPMTNKRRRQIAGLQRIYELAVQNNRPDLVERTKKALAKLGYTITQAQERNPKDPLGIFE